MTVTMFNALGLAEPIARALAEEGYETPTPIQAQAIPPALAGRDLIGIAQTGTGKTAAFALPILNRLDANPRRPEPKSVRVLVLAPTRELGGQIVDSFNAYGRHMRVRTTLAIGGVPIGKQIRALAAGVDVLVATPGRLLDLHDSRAVRFDRIEVFVLDEADRMLDMGFIRDIRKIVALVPRQRQTLFFSATMPPEIARLAGEMLSDPVKVAVTPAATTVERIVQSAIRVEKAGKPAALAGILKAPEVDRALVFTRTKHGADRVVKALEHAGIPAQAIHGNKTQGNRDRTMAAFRSGEIRTLVATDIAARGIDVDGISHVVNYDLPNIAETYVHRIGRTARAGADGIAVSLVSRDEMQFLRDIEKLIRRQVPFAGGVEQPQQPLSMQDEGERPARERHRNKGRPGQHRSRDANRDGGNKRPQRQAEGQKKNGRRRQRYGEKPANGGERSNHERNAHSRPEQGIGGIGFMNRPRRPGMQQGSATRLK
jgi:superfamily II DNA/RNA helicase